MNAIILYYSKTGFTKRYARWICEALSCECVPFEQRGQIDFSKYDTVIFGSWVHAGRIQKFGWLKKQLPAWTDKKITAFAVGAMPPDSPVTLDLPKNNLTPQEQGRVKLFYFPGGINYDKMSFFSKRIMKLFTAMMSKKQDKTPQEEEAARMLSQSYDLSGRKYTEPLLSYLRERV